jgi:hypothetical protein
VLQELVQVAGKVSVQALVTADELIAEGQACNKRGNRSLRVGTQA